MIRKNGLQLEGIQSEAELEIERITILDTKLSHYQADLQALLSKVSSQEDRLKTLCLLIAVKLSEIKQRIEAMEKSRCGRTNRLDREDQRNGE